MKRNYVHIILVTMLFAGICFSVSAQDSGWEQRTGYKYQKLLIKDLVCLHLSPNSDTIYTYNKDGFLRIWDFESGMLLDSVNFIDTVSKLQPNLFQFSSDGRTAVFASILNSSGNNWSKKVSVFDIGTKSILGAWYINFYDIFSFNKYQYVNQFSVINNYIYSKNELFVQTKFRTLEYEGSANKFNTSGYLGVLEIDKDTFRVKRQIYNQEAVDYYQYDDSLLLFSTYNNSETRYSSIRQTNTSVSTSTLQRCNVDNKTSTRLIYRIVELSEPADFIISRILPTNLQDIFLYKSNYKYSYYDLASKNTITNISIPFPNPSNTHRVIEAVYDTKDVLVMYQDSVFYFNNIKHLYRIDSIISPISVDSFFVVKNNQSLIAYNSKGEIVVLPIGTITSVPENNTITINTITLYPNPTSETLTVIGPEDATSIKIINSLGMEVASQMMRNSQTDINVHTWPSGVYFLQLTSPKGISTKKIEVIH